MNTIIDSGSPAGVIFSRCSIDNQHNLLILLNLDCDKAATLSWDASYAPFDEPVFHDLISGRRLEVFPGIGHKKSLSLSGGEYLCLSNEPDYLQMLCEQEKKDELYDQNLNIQEARVMILRTVVSRNSSIILDNLDLNSMVQTLLKDPLEFLHQLYSDRGECPVIVWNWEWDNHREVLLPVGHCLLVTASCRFRFKLDEELPHGRKNTIFQINSVQKADGTFFALIPTPRHYIQETPFRKMTVNMRVFCKNGRTQCSESHLMFLKKGLDHCKVSFSRGEIFQHSRTFLQTNGRGALIHQQVEIGKLQSRYDAVLLANLNPDYPEDRHIMFRRIRL